ncbi:hypothetical protein GW17_00037829 [Ensete ventricosum]|nr:hypothetical protein GW17_00037829 [Ensete ventricosum]
MSAALRLSYCNHLSACQVREPDRPSCVSTTIDNTAAGFADAATSVNDLVHPLTTPTHEDEDEVVEIVLVRDRGPGSKQ